jgi:hypothetical protein
MMRSAWRKAAALDASSGSSNDAYFRHAVVRGCASLANELCDWSSYEDAAMVIEWIAQLQQAPGSTELFSNITIKSIVAQGAVNARAMDLGLSMWKEIVGPLHTLGGGVNKELEIKGRCLLLHKLQFAAECAAFDHASVTCCLRSTRCPFASGTMSLKLCGTACTQASFCYRNVRHWQS